MHAFVAQGQGKIKISFYSENNDLNLVISDNGKGIPETDLSKIYDPFFTTRRGLDSTGLGLHIVYNIITQKYGGTIHCDSTLNEGTTFTLFFPNALCAHESE